MEVLRVGKVGELVKRWQFFLLGEGFDSGGADGIFAPKTEQATMAFQQKYGLVADGVVGNQTFGRAMLLKFKALVDPEDLSKTGPNWPPRPDFEPLVSLADRQAVFGAYDFEPVPHADRKERIRITGDWEAKNIIGVEIPQLIGVKGAPRNGRVQFHRLAAAQFKALWDAWDKAQLLPKVLTWDGSFDPRFIACSTESLSNHAFGSAFDLNCPWNQLGHEPAWADEIGSVRELVPLANEHGFYWGGHYHRRLDGMHFEIARLL